MKKILVSAALATAVMAFAPAGPAQALMANPGLHDAAPSNVTEAQYWRHRRGWRRGYYGRRWVCWRDWRGFRRCSWRY